MSANTASKTVWTLGISALSSVVRAVFILVCIVLGVLTAPHSDADAVSRSFGRVFGHGGQVAICRVACRECPRRVRPAVFIITDIGVVYQYLMRLGVRRSRRSIISTHPTHTSLPTLNPHTPSTHLFSFILFYSFRFVRVICGQSHSLFMSVFHFWISLLAYAWYRSSFIPISTSCPPSVVMDMYIVIYWVHYSQYICLIIKCIYSP